MYVWSKSEYTDKNFIKFSRHLMDSLDSQKMDPIVNRKKSILIGI